MEWRWKREGDERKWKLFARVSISGNVTRIKKKKRRSRFVLFQLSSSFDFLFKEFLASILCNLHNYNFIGFRIHGFLATGFEPVEAKNKKTPKDSVITEGNKIFRWKIPFFFFFSLRQRVSHIQIMDQKLAKIQRKEKKRKARST